MSDEKSSRGKIGTIVFFVVLIGISAATMLLAPQWGHGIEISLKAEPILHIGHVAVTNTVLASTLVVLFFVGFALVVRSKKNDLHSRFYNAVEAGVEAFFGLVQSTVGHKVARQIFPIIATFLLFILVNNWFGVTPIIGSIGIWEKHTTVESEKLEVESENSEFRIQNSGETAPGNVAGVEHTDSLPTADSPQLTTGEGGPREEPIENHEPGGENGLVFVPLLRSANSDLNMTLAIALISVAFIQVVAVRNVGFKSYIKTFLNFSSPIMFGVGLLEIISELVKIFSFSFRLFGNIFAGDVLLIVISSLVPFVGPIPFIGIELFSGMIQAVVFSMLTLAFLKSHLSHGETH